MTFRGHNQAAGGPGKRGVIPQRELVRVLRVLIDTARAVPGRGRDEARATIRDLLATANWRTPYVLRNIGARRCRYLAGMGYPVPAEFALRSTIETLRQWDERRG